MNPSRKGCQSCIVFFLALASHITAAPMMPPQPRFDEYLLPPSPAKEITEYFLHVTENAEAPQTPREEPVREYAAVEEPAAMVKAERGSSPESRPEPVKSQEPAPVVHESLSDSNAVESDNGSADDISPDVYVRLNDRFSLVIEGGSWLFVDAYPAGGIVYDGRIREERFMRFSFRARKNGRYILQFVQGSSGGGSGRTHRAAVEVLPEKEFTARVAGVAAIPETGIEGPADPETAEDTVLSGEERYRAALDYLINSKWESAFRVLTDSAEFDPADPSESTAAAFASALFMEDYMLALDYANFNPLLQQEFTGSILELGKKLTRDLRRRLLISALEILPRFHGIDRLVFALAGDYEQTGPDRNVEEAVRYYRYLLAEYPLSPYWQEAEERANYLERHFLLVR